MQYYPVFLIDFYFIIIYDNCLFKTSVSNFDMNWSNLGYLLFFYVSGFSVVCASSSSGPKSKNSCLTCKSIWTNGDGEIVYLYNDAADLTHNPERV